MNRFYLNDAVGAPQSVEEGGVALWNAIRAFGELQGDKSLQVSPRIVMAKDPDLTKFGEIYLNELIHSITDRDELRYALACLNNAYPVEDVMGMDDTDMPLLDAAYTYNDRDASNLAIVYNHGGLLLTIAFSDDLKSNMLVITSAAEPSEQYPASLALHSLYGEISNIKYIRAELEQRVVESASTLERLSAFGAIESVGFCREFNALTTEQQQSILDKFSEAKRMGLLYPEGRKDDVVIIHNKKTINHQTGTEKQMFFEVVVRHPLALRVFITQHQGKVYITKIGIKKEYKDDKNQRQNLDLQEAEQRFFAMIKGS